ncbi:MAG: energy-coupling factor transporter ATPase [Bacilli bacterium]|nr:energy-coupling factor transporter ATPase [Bacilli bacterium]
MNVLEVKNLNASYSDDQKVLNNVSFSIKQGDYVSILGHNGSGKSTLAKVIMGLVPNFNGEIIINGLALNKENIRTIRKEISMVFQNPDNQFIGTTVEDDIAFGLENRRVPHNEMAGIVEEFANKVGMGDFLNKEPNNLSGGQKQRVAIAGVLALNPKIIIFDEATSMLDPKGKKEIHKLIQKVREHNPNLTCISITHDIEEAYLSNYVIVLNHGEIARQGKPDEVLKDAEMLAKLNLKLPFIVQLREILKQKGYEVPDGASLEEIGDILCR